MKPAIPYIAILCLLFADLSQAQDRKQEINTTEPQPGWTSGDTAAIHSLINKSLTVKINTESRLSYLTAAFRRSLQTGYADGIAQSLLGIGVVYINNGAPEQSRLFLSKAYPYILHASGTDKDKLMVMWCNAMAIPYSMQGKYDTAIQYYYRALKEYEQRGLRDTGLLIPIYSNLGGIWMETDQSDKALDYLKSAESFTRPADHNHRGIIYINLSSTYINLKNYPKAREYASKALLIDMEEHDSINLQHDYYVLGKSYIDEQETAPPQGKGPDKKLNDQALLNFRKALLVDSLSTKMVVVFQGLGAAYALEKEYGLAEFYYKKGMQLTYQSGLLHERLSAYKSLAKTYTATRQFEQANQYQRAYSDLQDSC